MCTSQSTTSMSSSRSLRPSDLATVSAKSGSLLPRAGSHHTRDQAPPDTSRVRGRCPLVCMYYAVYVLCGVLVEGLEVGGAFGEQGPEEGLRVCLAGGAVGEGSAEFLRGA